MAHVRLATPLAAKIKAPPPSHNARAGAQDRPDRGIDAHRQRSGGPRCGRRPPPRRSDVAQSAFLLSAAGAQGSITAPPSISPLRAAFVLRGAVAGRRRIRLPHDEADGRTAHIAVLPRRLVEWLNPGLERTFLRAAATDAWRKRWSSADGMANENDPAPRGAGVSTSRQVIAEGSISVS